MNNIKFPSFKKGGMRVSITVCQNSSVLIWAESKATKSQWQLEVKDVTKHGPIGLPANLVFNLLKVNFISLVLMATKDGD